MKEVLIEGKLQGRGGPAEKKRKIRGSSVFNEKTGPLSAKKRLTLANLNSKRHERRTRITLKGKGKRNLQTDTYGQVKKKNETIMLI